MILNLGSGEELMKGAINVDLRTDCGADLVADVRDLPYHPGTVDHIYAFDVLEHFSKFETEPLLAEWHRVLKPGGLLTLRMPNLHVLAVQLSYWHAHPSAQLDDLINNIYGGHRWGPDGAWDTHHTGFSPASIAVVLDKAGFDLVSNDEGLNMTVEAVKR